LLISVNKLFSCFLRCSRNDSLESVIKEAVKVEEVTQRTHKGQGRDIFNFLKLVTQL